MFGATLAGDRSVCLTQCRLQRQGETHLWVSAIARSGREGRVSEMQERKEKAPRRPPACLLCSPLGQCRSLYCFLPGFILSTVPLLARPGPCSQPLWWGHWHGMGQSSDTCLGGELGKGGDCRDTQAQILQRQSLLSRSHQFERGKPKRPK